MSVEASATMNRQVATRVRANLVAVGAVEACRIGGGERREGANYQGAGHRPQLAGAFAALLLQRRGDTASSAHAASHTPGAPAACRAACSPACSTPDRRANLIFLSHFCPQCKVWVVPCGRDGAARKLGEPRCALWRSIQDFGIHAGLAQNVQLLTQDSDCVLHPVHSASAHRWRSGPKICGGNPGLSTTVQSNPYDSTQYTQRGQRRSIRSSKQRANNSREQPTAESSRATMRAFATALAVFVGTGVQAQGPGGFGGGVFGGTGRAWTNDNFVPCTAGPDCGPFFAEAAEGSSNNK